MLSPPPFQLFGTPHIVAMVAMLAVPIALSVAVRRLDSERATRVVCVVFSHAGIVAAALFATWGPRMRPTFKSLVRAFVAMNVMAAVMACVNLALDSNYMYLCEVPVTASPFLFLPRPWYVGWLDVLALVFFGFVYLPVYLVGRG